MSKVNAISPDLPNIPDIKFNIPQILVKLIEYVFLNIMKFNAEYGSKQSKP